MDNNIFRLEKNSKVLALLGVAHTFDPSHPQFESIEKQWTEFVSKTNGSPRVVVLEAWQNGYYLSDHKLATKAGGESGFLTSLAFKEGIGITCPEPDRASEFRHLEKTFEKSVIAHYYFVRPLTQWHRMNDPKPTLEQYLTSFVQRDQKHSSWPEFNYSLENLKQIHQDSYGKPIENINYEELIELINPTLEKFPTNKVAKALHDFRNESIAMNIKRYWDKGNSLFVIYGSGHFQTLKEKLESLL